MSSNRHEYQYDERGRLIEETQKVNNEAYVTRYTYRADDQIETMIYPDGEVITTTYNVMGLPDTLKGTLAGQYTNLPLRLGQHLQRRRATQTLRPE